MRRLLAAIGLLLVTAMPTLTQTQPEEPLSRTITHNGAEREYFVRLPDGFNPDRTYWLVVVVHPSNGNGRTSWMASGIRRVADRVGLAAIVVSPTFSLEDSLAASFPILGEGHFLETILTELAGEYRVHPKILLTGYSMGGQFAHRFAFGWPELVEAVAPHASGTWTTPDGQLLVDVIGSIDDPATYLASPRNAAGLEDRQALFSSRTAQVAGLRPQPGAEDIPFFVMCGTLDRRHGIAQQFAASLDEAGFEVETSFPRTDHVPSDETTRREFGRYFSETTEFFLRVTQRR
jgi:poly(3-hydroxybutyrate) depolymerase